MHSGKPIRSCAPPSPARISRFEPAPECSPPGHERPFA
jgi:hypothetical protein